MATETKSSIGRCFNGGVRVHFAQDFRKPKKEALLVNVDEEATLM
jgi:hypothetical protein